jgi:hypothetical protein
LYEEKVALKFAATDIPIEAQKDETFVKLWVLMCNCL